jgi:predicted PurR-regulated permease PerM
MSLLSVIPGLGTAVIWVPASIVLLITGDTGRAIGLALFCGLVVGTIDNILRPRLVGADTRMHPLLILFSTMGGLAFFGFPGVIVGPILTALFITIWEMFGAEFRDSIDRARGIAR